LRTVKEAASTFGARTLSVPTGSVLERVANSASVTRRPAENTIWALQSSRLSSTTRSARQPGATSPRSRNPKARAAEIEAAR
jgi:hypothetical protein